MKKTLTIFTAGMAVLSLVGCSAKTTNDVAKTDTPAVEIQEPEVTDSTQIANPWTEANSLAEATTLAGFDFTLPEQIENNTISYIQAIENEIISVDYGDSVTVRKGNSNTVGETADGIVDISGNYNTYSETIQLEVGDITVQAKDNGEGYNNIVWNLDGYYYSITSETGLSVDVVENLAKTII